MFSELCWEKARGKERNRESEKEWGRKREKSKEQEKVWEKQKKGKRARNRDKGIMKVRKCEKKNHTIYSFV